MAIGWALLGPGRHADMNVAPQMRKAAGVERVAVLSRDRARGEAFARRHGFAKVYTSLGKLLADPEIDAVYDSTPDGAHADNTVAAARAGKHALVEKPLAISARECERAIEACRGHGVKLGVVYQQRHEEVHQEARRMVKAGEVGDIHLARVQVTLRPQARTVPPGGGNWRADPKLRSGGALMSLGDHAFDTLAYLVDQDIEQIVAFTDATRDDPPNERVASMLLKLSKGTIGHAVSGGKAPFARRPIEVHGAKGTLILENSFAYLTGTGEDPRTSLELVNGNGGNVRYFDATECFRLEIEQFSRAIEGMGEPMTTAEEGLHAITISETFYQAIRSGSVAKVVPLAPKS
jgi:1,5-anhydro-D-fructose reductase (1,5-anhydro-D-mannitol-forming)